MALLLSYSTWGMPQVPIEVAVAHCAGLGFDGLELTVCPGWSTEGTSLTTAQRREIRRLYTDHGIALGGLCANTPLLAEDPAEHAANLDRFRAYLDLAAELQAAGLRPGGHLALLGPTSRPLVTAIQATWLAGATLVVRVRARQETGRCPSAGRRHGARADR